jgi:hypothetical protein
MRLRSKWKDIHVQRSTLEDIGKRLKVQQLNDWYKIRNADIIHHGGSGLLSHYGNSLSKLLRTVYPEYPSVVRNEIVRSI